jgi:uncharacterized protein
MRFEIYKSKGEWRWRLKARNGEVIANGEGYKNKIDCRAIVAQIQSLNTRMASVEELVEEEPEEADEQIVGANFI